MRMVSWHGRKTPLNTKLLPAGCFASESNDALAWNKSAHIFPLMTMSFRLIKFNMILFALNFLMDSEIKQEFLK